MQPEEPTCSKVLRRLEEALASVTSHCLFLGSGIEVHTPSSGMKILKITYGRDFPLALFRVQYGSSHVHKWHEDWRPLVTMTSHSLFLESNMKARMPTSNVKIWKPMLLWPPTGSPTVILGVTGTQSACTTTSFFLWTWWLEHYHDYDMSGRVWVLDSLEKGDFWCYGGQDLGGIHDVQRDTTTLCWSSPLRKGVGDYGSMGSACLSLKKVVSLCRHLTDVGQEKAMCSK